ncbi:transcriptional regulator TbsP [Halolamina sp. C58]|uniref:transcriptional regulator TbsP n=1 Tax=Halolamina sp. C58 TaxID=3421640 RepID=UPI003EC0607B
MSSNLLGDEIEDILRESIEDADGEILFVGPSAAAVEALIGLGTEFDGEFPTVKLLADERLLKDVMDDFLVASNAADLVEAGSLELRTLEGGVDNALLVTEARTIAVVTAGDAVAGLATDDESFVGQAHEDYSARFEAAETFNLRTPAISRVRETMEDDIGEQSRTDFDAVLDSLETARGDGDGLDEVTISLLVAAKNDVLLYDISKWGEDVGIASKATFSRTKTRLEELGLIDTEKVPIDVGRPRLRLKLGDDRLHDADAEELASVAQSMIAS